MQAEVGPLGDEVGPLVEKQSCKGLAWNLLGHRRKARARVEGQRTFEGIGVTSQRQMTPDGVVGMTSDILANFVKIGIAA